MKKTGMKAKNKFTNFQVFYSFTNLFIINLLLKVNYLNLFIIFLQTYLIINNYFI